MNNMLTTRQKRPDRVICKFGKNEVRLHETGNIIIFDEGGGAVIFLPSEIPNLIKALEEIQK